MQGLFTEPLALCIVIPRCPVMSCYVPLCPSMSRYVLLCPSMSRYVPLCPVMSRYVQLCISPDGAVYPHHTRGRWLRYNGSPHVCCCITTLMHRCTTPLHHITAPSTESQHCTTALHHSTAPQHCSTGAAQLPLNGPQLKFNLRSMRIQKLLRKKSRETFQCRLFCVVLGIMLPKISLIIF